MAGLGEMGAKQNRTPSKWSYALSSWEASIRNTRHTCQIRKIHPVRSCVNVFCVIFIYFRSVLTPGFSELKMENCNLLTYATADHNYWSRTARLVIVILINISLNTAI